MDTPLSSGEETRGGIAMGVASNRRSTVTGWCRFGVPRGTVGQLARPPRHSSSAEPAGACPMDDGAVFHVEQSVDGLHRGGGCSLQPRCLPLAEGTCWRRQDRETFRVPRTAAARRLGLSPCRPRTADCAPPRAPGRDVPRDGRAASAWSLGGQPECRKTPAWRSQLGVPGVFHVEL